MKYTIKVEKLLPYPTQQVWSAITDPQTLTSWFMPTDDFEAALHHEFTFRMKPQRGWDGITHCEVIEIDPGRRIAFSYRGSATGEKTLACARVDSETAKKIGKGIFTELDTVLSFTLTPEYTCGGLEQTRFVLEHSGFNGFKLGIVGRVMGSGWRSKIVPRLQAVLASLPQTEVSGTRELHAEASRS